MDKVADKEHDKKCDDNYNYSNNIVLIIFLILILLLLGTWGNHC